MCSGELRWVSRLESYAPKRRIKQRFTHALGQPSSVGLTESPPPPPQLYHPSTRIWLVPSIGKPRQLCTFGNIVKFVCICRLNTRRRRFGWRCRNRTLVPIIAPIMNVILKRDVKKQRQMAYFDQQIGTFAKVSYLPRRAGGCACRRLPL